MNKTLKCAVIGYNTKKQQMQCGTIADLSTFKLCGHVLQELEIARFYDVDTQLSMMRQDAIVNNEMIANQPAEWLVLVDQFKKLVDNKTGVCFMWSETTDLNLCFVENTTQEELVDFSQNWWLNNDQVIGFTAGDSLV